MESRFCQYKELSAVVEKMSKKFLNFKVGEYKINYLRERH